MRSAAGRIAVGSLLVAAVLVSSHGRGADRHAGYAFRIDPAGFTTEITNPLLPLRPDARWVYEGPSTEGHRRIVVEVTDERRTVMGVSTVVVRETVTVGGEVVEETIDWYAQDSDGNVWSFGEDTREYRHGRAVRGGDSWEAGVDGARPGIVMEARPRVGDRYRKEHAPGKAEDIAEVLSLRQRASVPFGDFDVVVIEYSSPLDPGSSEHEFYAQGVGSVLEITVEDGDWVELVEMTHPLPPARR